MRIVGYERSQALIEEAFPGCAWSARSIAVPVGAITVELRAASDRDSEGVQMRASVPGIPPVWMWLTDGRTHSIGAGAPVLPTGDPTFDAAFTVRGTPQELVAAALDPALRAVIATRFDRTAQLEVKDGVVEVKLPRRGLSVEGVREVVHAVGRLSASLGRAYRSQLELAMATRGALAAQTMESAWRAELDAVGRSQRVGAMITLLFVIALLVSLAIVAVVLWLALR